MPEIVEYLNNRAAAWAGTVWAVTWQSMLLALVVGAVAFLLRRSSPAVRYWLWQIVAVKLLIMPFWTLAVPLPSPITRAEPSPSPQAAANKAAPLPDDVQPDALDIEPLAPAAAPQPLGEPSRRAGLAALDWRAWLLIGWTLVVATQVVRIAMQRLRLRRLLRATTPADDLAAQAERAAADLGLSRAPAAVLTDVDCSPFVCGLVRPTLVLPKSLTAALDPAALRHVLLHELAHVKRRDLVWGWLPEIARTVYFFHPVAHWVAFQARLERELACDQLAMAVTGSPAADYAQTLVRVVAHASEPSAFKTAVSTLGLNGNDTSCERTNPKLEQRP
jgi:beta-lactamase regulating signal transducer with metallopeptidase domain